MSVFFPLTRKCMRLDGEKNAALEQARGRMALIGIVFAFAYFMLAVRVFDLTIIEGELSLKRYADVSQAAPAQEEELLRADIVDRNGVILARTLNTASLYADPKIMVDPEGAARRLAELFPHLDARDLKRRFHSKRRFVWVARNLTPREQYQVLQIGEPGLNFTHEPKRIYPQGNLATHVIGYTDIDGNGLAGVERGLNDLLESDQKPWRVTLDVRVQHIVRREIQRAISEYGANAGVGIVMDVSGGEVIAAVSLPDFDPHDPGAASDAEKFNRLTLGVYEAGSIFKIFSTAAILEYENTPMSRRYDAREPLEFGRHKIRDFHPQERQLSLPEVFVFSSNIGSAIMGQELGAERLKKFYRDLGLFDAPDIAIPEVGRPLMPSPWRDINTLTAAYGHGVAASPLQTAAAVASAIGDGTLVRPRFVMGETSKNPETRILRPQITHRMRQLLRLAVTHGTGSKADVPGYEVGGKTGTAEKIIGGQYSKKNLLSSFVGVFPMSAPRYVVLAMVDEPKGTRASFGYATGGWVAAPAVANIIEASGPLLGVPVKSETESAAFAAPLERHIRIEEKEKRLVTY